MNVSLQQCVANARMILGLISNDQDGILLKLISDGARRCECDDNLVDDIPSLLIIDNFTSELPLGTVQIKGLRFTGSSNEKIYPSFISNNFAIFKDSNNLNSGCGYSFSYDNGYLLFSPNTPYQTAELIYTGFALDEDGFPLISEKMELAIQYFCAWQFSRINRDKYSPDTIKEWKDEWLLAVAKCRRKSKPTITMEAPGQAYNRFYVRQLTIPYTFR